MNVGDYFSPTVHAIWQFWRAQLAPTRGRAEFTLRVLVTCLLVIVISNALRIPYLSLSMLATIVVVQANAAYSKLLSIVVSIAMLVNIFAIIIILKLFYSDPMLRVVVSIFVFFVFIYLMRAVSLGVLLMPAAATIMMMMAIPVDLPDIVVRAMLWIWIALSYPCFVSMLINTYMFPGEPSLQLREEMTDQIKAVIVRLENLASGQIPVAAVSEHQFQKDATALQQLLSFLKMREPENISKYLYLQACAATVTRVQVCTDTLVSSPSRPEGFGDALRALRDGCEQFRQALSEDYPLAVEHLPASPQVVAAGGAPAQEILCNLQALAQFEIEKQAQPEKQAIPMLVDDAFSNPSHLHFALKVTLACTIGYIFYNAVQWQGIHTVTLTCILVVYPIQLGWTIRRMVWRIVGALLGSLWALVLIVFIFPYIDTITGLLIAVTPMLLTGGWIMVGPERTSYVGFQLITTASLALFDNFKPPTDLVEVRDRLVGILLGVVISAIIYTQIWPDSESNQLRGKLVAMLKEFGTLIKSASSGRASEDLIAYGTQHQKCWVKINECEEILIRVSLEPGFRRDHPARLVSLAHSLLGHCREILIAQDGIRTALHALGSPLPAGAQKVIDDILTKADGALNAYADAIAQRSAPPHLDQRQIINPVSEKALSREKYLAGASNLQSDIERLARIIAELPDWSTDGAFTKTHIVEATP